MIFPYNSCNIYIYIYIYNSYSYPYLVGGLERIFYLSIQLGISSSQLTNSYFSEG